LLIAFNYLLGKVFPPGVVAALLIALEVLVAGGLHMDGLMDTADGLMGSREREKSLLIMRDSRVGAMGAMAAVLVLLVKWTLIAAVLDSGQEKIVLAALLLMPTLGRYAMVIGLYLFPYARSEEGLGRVFAAGTGRLQLFVASVWALAACWYWGGVFGLWTIFGVILFTSALSYYMAGRLGGLTGDTYGTLEELGEVVCLLLIVGLLGMY
ncbi:MAG: adenosylcobinamide-GDP ribazoletransferase, partial [Ignavibacteriales bacterium]